MLTNAHIAASQDATANRNLNSEFRMERAVGAERLRRHGGRNGSGAAAGTTSRFRRFPVVSGVISPLKSPQIQRCSQMFNDFARKIKNKKCGAARIRCATARQAGHQGFRHVPAPLVKSNRTANRPWHGKSNFERNRLDFCLLNEQVLRTFCSPQRDFSGYNAGDF